VSSVRKVDVPPSPPSPLDDDDELEWEEWDGKGLFWHHCVAGSLAGVTEHTLLYPVDTVKTHIQACASCPHQAQKWKGLSTPGGTKPTQVYSNLKANYGMMSTMRHLVYSSQALTAVTASDASSSIASATENTRNEAANSLKPFQMARLWRGVQTMILGCIPAHAFYFSSYEITKAYFIEKSPDGNLSPVGGMAAGAAATFGHDCVMGPLDTIKQRLQLGHYKGLFHAAQEMFRHEGASALYRSFPITLLTNVPYGMVMVSTNEFLKQKWTKSSENTDFDLQTCLMASSLSGMVAAAGTTPLDRIKTTLQTQRLQPARHCEQGSCPQLKGVKPLQFQEVFQLIVQREGYAGFFRGMLPRVVTHTPAVAISWTTYETAKQWLAHLD